MKRVLKIFMIGSAAYPLIEILWRGRTHPTMALAGGLGLWGIDWLASKPLPLWIKCSLSAAILTGIEGVLGLTFNRKYQIWDYRKIPGNWRGQICAAYSLLWGLLSLPALLLLQKR